SFFRYLPRRISIIIIAIICIINTRFFFRIETLQDSNGEMPNDFLNELHKWSLESIAKVALDVRLGCLDKNSHPDTQKLIDAVNTFFINVPVLELKMPFWRIFRTPTFVKYIDALDTIREICMKYINNSLNNSAKSNEGNEISVLQRVLGLENNTKVASILALDMFLVGIDTTSNAAASVLYQLAIHPQKQHILKEEIMKILPNCKTIITNERLEQMHYLKACIKETMRMYPVVIGNGRQTTNDCIIGGYHIPRGNIIRSPPYLLVLEKRMCLGRRFADLELQTLLAQIIRNYTLEYHHENLDYFIHPMYTPNGPLRLRFIKNED
ncbi:hypothetical protein NQ314_018981, partial [Rhamnusium bicolor]